jgi:hypothetical protein
VIGGGGGEEEEGITLREFRSVQLGTSQEDIERRFGTPEDTQEFEQQIPELQDTPARSSCIYYPERGQPIFEGRVVPVLLRRGGVDEQERVLADAAVVPVEATSARRVVVCGGQPRAYAAGASAGAWPASLFGGPRARGPTLARGATLTAVGRLGDAAGPSEVAGLAEVG